MAAYAANFATIELKLNKKTKLNTLIVSWFQPKKKMLLN